MKLIFSLPIDSLDARLFFASMKVPGNGVPFIQMDVS